MFHPVFSGKRNRRRPDRRNPRGWLLINLLIVKEELRGRGYGHQLLTMAEEEARKMGAKNAYLDTFTFQAPEFYKKHGYHVFGELKDFPPGHARCYYTKQL